MNRVALPVYDSTLEVPISWLVVRLCHPAPKFCFTRHSAVKTLRLDLLCCRDAVDVLTLIGCLSRSPLDWARGDNDQVPLLKDFA